ncbi:hypothetical protein BGZ46_001840, partial [Entomortierella lignicola]
MSRNHITYRNHHFAAAAATIVSPLPSPAMSVNDSYNPWSNIMTPAPAPTGVYSNNAQPTISFDGSSQPKTVINDVFLSSTMLYDDVELYLNESSSSCFDSDSDSGFSTPSHNDDEHPSCFSAPMTPMSPFMENDTENQLYVVEECSEPMDLPEQQEHSKNKPATD